MQPVKGLAVGVGDKLVKLVVIFFRNLVLVPGPDGLDGVDLLAV